MNTKTFAVAAVFGASAAIASECPIASRLPTNFEDLSWRGQALEKFSYMDICPQDGVLSYRELKRYSGDLPRGLLQEKDPTSNLDQVFLGMLRMDSNQDQQVSLEEYLRREQTFSSPIIEAYDEDQVFNYMTCKPQVNSSDKSSNCLQSYDRTDLRSTIWMLEDIGRIVNHQTTNEGRLEAYELFVNKEMRLRDYDRDGKITREEHDRHELYKQTVKSQFDGLTDDIDDTYISRDTYVDLGSDHPWLQQYGADVAFDKLDTNEDNQLSFYEAFEGAQLDDMIRRRFEDFFQALDLDRDNRVNKSDFVAFLESYIGTWTSDQYEELAEKLFQKYSHLSSVEPNGEQVIEKNEFWMVFSLDNAGNDARIAREQDLPYHSKTGWITVDSDHDDIVLTRDLIGVIPDADIGKIQAILNKRSTSDAVTWAKYYEKVVLHEFYGIRRLRKIWQHAIYDGEASYTFTLADISNDRARAYFKQTQEELEQVFHKIDSNHDGEVDGEEACRYWAMGGWGFMCEKFAPEHSDHWIDTVEDWVENPLSYP